jgi:hypothetical protein
MRRARLLERFEGADIAGLWGSAPRDGRIYLIGGLDRLSPLLEAPRGWSADNADLGVGCTSVFGIDKSTQRSHSVAACCRYGALR